MRYLAQPHGPEQLAPKLMSQFGGKSKIVARKLNSVSMMLKDSKYMIICIYIHIYIYACKYIYIYTLSQNAQQRSTKSSYSSCTTSVSVQLHHMKKMSARNCRHRRQPARARP